MFTDNGQYTIQLKVIGVCHTKLFDYIHAPPSMDKPLIREIEY